MVLDIVLIVVGVVALIVGVIGCVAPIVPGPLVAFVSLLLAGFAAGWTYMPVWLLIVLGALAVGVTIADNFLPALASRRAGAGRGGVWGSVIGMLLGAFLFPPFGIIIGAFFGALVGEITFRSENTSPWRAAVAVFSGTMFGILLKLLVTGVIGFYFVRGAIAAL